MGKKKGGEGYLHFLSKLGVGRVSLSSGEGRGVYCFDKKSGISNQVKKIRQKFKIA